MERFHGYGLHGLATSGTVKAGQLSPGRQNDLRQKWPHCHGRPFAESKKPSEVTFCFPVNSIREALAIAKVAQDWITVAVSRSRPVLEECSVFNASGNDWTGHQFKNIKGTVKNYFFSQRR